MLSRYNPQPRPASPSPQSKDTDYNLRQRTHNLTLPMDVNAVMKQNFVYRMVSNTFIDFFIKRSPLFYETFFIQRHSHVLILPNLCVY